MAHRIEKAWSDGKKSLAHVEVGFIEPAGGDGFRRLPLQFCDLDREVQNLIVLGLHEQTKGHGDHAPLTEEERQAGTGRCICGGYGSFDGPGEPAPSWQCRLLLPSWRTE